MEIYIKESEKNVCVLWYVMCTYYDIYIPHLLVWEADIRTEQVCSFQRDFVIFPGFI